MNWCSFVGACALLVGWTASSTIGAPTGLSLYVATNGNDAWSGRLPQPNRARTDGPFATFPRARDEVRKQKAEGLAGGVRVEIAGGAYQLAAPLEFTAEDSGTADCTIEYCARRGEEVRLVGGRTVSGWALVKDPAILARLNPSARGKIFQADLGAAGVTDLQGINSAGTYRSDPGLELFFGGRPMTLARYPNQGYMKIADVLDAEGAVIKSPQATTSTGRFVCEDRRPEHWAGEKDIWLHGFWIWDWADLRVRLGAVDAEQHALSLAGGGDVRKGQWFYAENVLPELDSPGEWYLDRESAIIYFRPPSPLRSGEAVVSTVRDLVRLTDVSYVTLRGLTIEAGRGSAVLINGGSHVRIVGCTLRNVGNWAVLVKGGTEHRVLGCDIYQTGQGGITFDAGDRKTLTHAGPPGRQQPHSSHGALGSGLPARHLPVRRWQQRYPQPDRQRAARGDRLQRQRPDHRVQRDSQRRLPVE